LDLGREVVLTRMESLMTWESLPGGGAPGTSDSLDDSGEGDKGEADEDDDADVNEDVDVDKVEADDEFGRMDSAALLLWLHPRTGRAWERSSRLGPAARRSLMVWCGVMM
jgi:hypothetical protein